MRIWIDFFKSFTIGFHIIAFLWKKPGRKEYDWSIWDKTSKNSFFKMSKIIYCFNGLGIWGIIPSHSLFSRVKVTRAPLWAVHESVPSLFSKTSTAVQEMEGWQSVSWDAHLLTHILPLPLPTLPSDSCPSRQQAKLELAVFFSIIA